MQVVVRGSRPTPTTPKPASTMKTLLFLGGTFGAVFLDATVATFLLRSLESSLFLRLVLQEGIHVAAEFHGHGRGEQIEAFAEHVGEITLVGFRHMRGLAAVHHDARRIASTLVRI